MNAFLQEYSEQRAALEDTAREVAESWRRYREVTGVDEQDEAGLLSLDLEAVQRAMDRHLLAIGVFGLIKRGKSTLVNALVGEEVSGAHVTPETAVPVYVEHGATPEAEVRFIDGRTEHVSPREALSYTSQKHNENNRQGVLVVRQRVDSPLLANGVRLVDTPGLDDADADENYTRATLEEIRSVDAALVTLLSPPTIGATEIAFLRTLAVEGPDHVVFVLNMYPQHFHDPVTKAEITTYVRDQLGAHLPGRDVDLFAVCAQDGWEGRRDGATDRWEASGVADLLRFLEDRLAHRARRDLLGEASATIDRCGRAMIDQARRRRALMTQPSVMAQHRQQIEEAADQATAQLRTSVALAIADADRRHRRLRVAIEQSFGAARSGLRKVESEDALKRELRRVRRGVELRCTVAGRGLAESLQHTITELQSALARAVEQSGHLLDLPEEVAVEVDEDSLVGLSVSDAAAQLDTAMIRSLGTAAAGGAIVGGVGAMAVGALLGPLGLVGGALAGWRLGGATGIGGTLQRLKEVADERVSVLAGDVLRAYDLAATGAVEELREAAQGRVDAYARELTAPIRDVERIAEDPELVEAERRAVATLFTELSVLLERLVTENEDVLVVEVPPSGTELLAGV